jgi:hypothetical protein
MNKDEMKEDIIRDINNLLSKENKEENINELFNSSISDKKLVQQNPQQKVSIQPQQQQITPQQMQQIQQHQMQQQQIQQQQMQQQQMQQQQLQQQLQQQQLQQQMQHQQMHMPQMQQLTPQQQQQMQQQLINQQLLQQGINPQMMTPQMIQKLQQMHNPGITKEQMSNTVSSSDSISNIIFSQRDSLVLFLLYVILLTPQVNSLMNKIPYTSNDDNYPGYLGILLRGLIFISLYVSMKSLNLL